MPRVCVGTFVTDSGLVSQTIPVADAAGTFLPKIVLFQGGWAIADTLETLANTGYTWQYDYGAGDGTNGGAQGSGIVQNFGGKVGSGAGSTLYSVLDTTPNIAFGGLISGYASITAMAIGSFTITWALHDRAGDARIFVAIGGDDLDVNVQNSGSANGTYTTPSQPQGFFGINSPSWSASPSAATGAGGSAQAFGWTAKDSGQGALSSYSVGQGDNYSAVWTDRFAQLVTSSGGQAGGTPVINTWNDLSYVITGSTAAAPLLQIAFCGTDILCRAGAFTQRATAGNDIVATGINPKLFVLGSVGRAGLGTVFDTVCQSTIGFSDQVNQASYWTGEAFVGVIGTPLGARYLSTDTIARTAGTINGGSTTFDSTGTITRTDTVTGDVTVTWDAVSGDEPDYIWFALGEAIPVPPTPSFHTTTFVRRRLRRSPILWSENQGLQTQVRVNLIAVDMQPGVSTQVETPDAKVMIRASKDGGRTWTSERFVSVGAIGAYTQRLNTWRWGQGRQWVVEVSTSDPVTFNLIQLLIDAEPGTS